MKSNWIVRLLAMVLALMMAVPALAMAEDEIVVAEQVDEVVAAEGEFTLGGDEAEVIAEAPAEVIAEEPVEVPAEEPVEVPAEEPAEVPAEEPVEVPAEEPVEVPAEEPAEVPAEEPAEEPAELEETELEEIVEESAEEPVEEAVELAPVVEEEPVVAEDVVEEAAALMAGETAPTPQKYTTGTLTKNAGWTLNIGDTLQLVTATTPKSYKSNKKKVATVTASGLVTAVKAGKAKITIQLTKKKKITVTVTVKDPYKPTKVTLSGASSVLYIGMGNPQLTATLTPSYAKTSLKWKSSNKKVLKVSASGVLTPVKAGKAKITVTTSNKKKATFTVTVRKNIVDGINAKPSKALIKSIGKAWTIGPKSVERKANGNYVCKFWIINGLGKSKQINNLGMDLWINGEKVGGKTWSKIKVVCGKGKTKLFSVTYTPADMVKKDAIMLAGLTKDKVVFDLTSTPTLTYKK